MRPQSLILPLILSVAHPVAGLAGEHGFFAGLDVEAGIAGGSSGTTDGGAPFAGGGIIHDVEFGTTTGIGGHIGYRFDPAWSLFVSYRHVEGDIRWTADFPLFGVASEFEGSAISNMILGNAAYKIPLSSATAIKLELGAGVTFNKLSGVVETDQASGIFLSNVANDSKLRPVGRIGAGLQYRITPKLAFGLDGAFSYFGGFATGNARSGNLGITAINPYKIKNIWRASIGASVKLEL